MPKYTETHTHTHGERKADTGTSRCCNGTGTCINNNTICTENINTWVLIDSLSPDRLLDLNIIGTRNSIFFQVKKFYWVEIDIERLS